MTLAGGEGDWRHLLRNGTEREFEMFVEAFAPRLWRHLRGFRVAHADAEDVVQETFLRAWRHRQSYDPTWAVSTWLFTIARNLIISMNRARRPHVDIDPEVSDMSQRPVTIVEDDVWVCARRVLDARSYEALWLRYGDDLPQGDIAQLMGLTPGHVRVIIHRAQERLAAELGSGATHV